MSDNPFASPDDLSAQALDGSAAVATDPLAAQTSCERNRSPWSPSACPTLAHL